MPMIAIAGNPNAGKTSLFNMLTGAMHQVGNYPGVTVERKEGTLEFCGQKYTVVDLPGTYSLTAYSQEERIARNVIIEEIPALVINVVDASNLERNLYLTVQLMEMRVPMVIALNMYDIAERRGFFVDIERLAAILGIPVVATVSNRRRGIDELTAACESVLSQDPHPIPHPVTYGHEVEAQTERIGRILQHDACFPEEYPIPWLTAKLLEEDEAILETARIYAGDRFNVIEDALFDAKQQIERHFKESASTILAERRYGFAAGAVKGCLEKTGEARLDLTQKIDTVVCNRFLGPIVLFGVVATLFAAIFKLSDEWSWIPWFGGWLSPTGLMVWFFEQLSGLIAPLEAKAPMLHSLINDGIIGGVGGVMEFVPLIFIMFLFVSALEDTGYIARVAFILDRVLQTFGLQGKSILAMIVSGGLGTGGCAVPGVMATRTLREEKDRLVTMLVVPFMNCGAKMPVYAMLIAAFFPAGRTRVMLILWALSWVVALAAAWVLRRFVIKGEQTPFVMELPPYHIPVWRGVLQHTWERTWMYIRKAGTIILAINIVLWALMYFPQLPEARQAELANATDEVIAAETLSHSMAGRFGIALEPVSQWAGFDWRTNIALIGGFAAKEVVVGTLGTAYSMGDVDPDASESLSDRLKHDPGWDPLKAFSLMIFVMIYAPCLVTLAVIRRESGSWKWPIFSTAFNTSIAFILATLVYQVGKVISSML